MKKRKLLKTGLAVTLAVMTLEQPVSAANWVHNNTGWWWREDNGSYPANQWKAINGTWYWFDSNGYMATGWRKINGTWYWMDASGAMATGWRNIGGKWYWMDASGAMATGWRNINGTWYYLESSGAMASNKWIGNYYVEASGAMATNKWIGNYYVNGSGLWTQTRTTGQWISSGNRWWYRHSDGTYTRNGWETIAGTDYLFDGSGWMLTGWQSVNGTWYYMNSSGGKVTNQWVGNYYVDGSGAWVETKGQHHWNNGVETIAATCNKAGSKTYTCTVCGEKKTESIPASEAHIYNDGVVSTRPTCDKEGVKTFACMRCDAIKKESIPALGHDPVTKTDKGHYVHTVIKAAWDEDIWESRYICNGCGKEFKTDDEAAEHVVAADMSSPCDSYYAKSVKVNTIHHPEQATDEWVVDPYTVCRRCGQQL